MKNKKNKKKKILNVTKGYDYDIYIDSYSFTYI